MSDIPDWLRPAPIRFQPLNKAKENYFTSDIEDEEEEEEEAPGPTPTPAPGPKNIKAIVDSERVIVKYLIKLDLDKVENKEDRFTPFTGEVTCKMKIMLNWKNWLRCFKYKMFNTPYGVFEVSNHNLAYIYWHTRVDGQKDDYFFFELEVQYVSKPGTVKFWNNNCWKTGEVGSVNYLDDNGDLIPPIYKLDKNHKYFKKSDILKRDMFGMGLSFPLSQGDIKWENIRNTWRYIFAFDQMLRPEDKLVGGWEISFEDMIFAYIKSRFNEYKRKFIEQQRLRMHELWEDNQHFIFQEDVSTWGDDFANHSFIYKMDYKEARNTFKFRKHGNKIDGPIKVNRDTKDIYD